MYIADYWYCLDWVAALGTWKVKSASVGYSWNRLNICSFYFATEKYLLNSQQPSEIFGVEWFVKWGTDCNYNETV